MHGPCRTTWAKVEGVMRAESRLDERGTWLRAVALFAWVLLLAMPRLALSQDATHPAGEEVILATTTSTADTGLLDALAPLFEEKTGITLKPIAVGSGAALELGEEGEAECCWSTRRRPKRNSWPADTASTGGWCSQRLRDRRSGGRPRRDRRSSSATEAMTKIAAAEATFISRGDDSGTHGLELGCGKRRGSNPGELGTSSPAPGWETP